MYQRIMFLLTIGVCVIFISAPIVNAQFPTDGVVGYWSFDAGTISGKNVKDQLGKNDGELDGNPKVVAGKVGNGLEFDSNNFVHIPGTDTLDFNGAEAITVAAWVKGASDKPVDGAVAGTCCGTIVAQRDVNGWALRFDGRNAGAELEFITQPGWQGDGGFGASALPKGEWHHIIGIVDGNKKYLYVDGKLNMEGDYNGPMSTQGTETEIGSATDGGFIGVIDEVVIYDRAISENEVRQLYAAEGLPVQPQGKLATRWGQIKTTY